MLKKITQKSSYFLVSLKADNSSALLESLPNTTLTRTSPFGGLTTKYPFFFHLQWEGLFRIEWLFVKDVTYKNFDKIQNMYHYSLKFKQQHASHEIQGLYSGNLGRQRH